MRQPRAGLEVHSTHGNLESKIIFGIYVSAGQRVPCQPFKTLLTCWAIVAAIEVVRVLVHGRQTKTKCASTRLPN